MQYYTYNTICNRKNNDVCVYSVQYKDTIQYVYKPELYVHLCDVCINCTHVFNSESTIHRGMPDYTYSVYIKLC